MQLEIFVNLTMFQYAHAYLRIGSYALDKIVCLVLGVTLVIAEVKCSRILKLMVNSQGIPS